MSRVEQMKLLGKFWEWAAKFNSYHKIFGKLNLFSEDHLVFDKFSLHVMVTIFTIQYAIDIIFPAVWSITLIWKTTILGKKKLKWKNLR